MDVECVENTALAQCGCDITVDWPKTLMLDHIKTFLLLKPFLIDWLIVSFSLLSSLSDPSQVAVRKKAITVQLSDIFTAPACTSH